MVKLKLEAVQDPGSGRYFLEIYYPEDASEPMVTTAPIYATAAAAEGDLIATLAVFASRPGA